MAPRTQRHDHELGLQGCRTTVELPSMPGKLDRGSRFGVGFLEIFRGIICRTTVVEPGRWWLGRWLSAWSSVGYSVTLSGPSWYIRLPHRHAGKAIGARKL